MLSNDLWTLLAAAEENEIEEYLLDCLLSHR